MKDGDLINFSELSRKYGIKRDDTKLGGMVVKEYLEKEGVDITRFNRINHTPQRSSRRKLKRLPGGEITVPVPPTNDDVREAIKIKLQEGQYCLGELIIPRKYKKIIVDKNGKLKEGYYTVSGRKIPMLEIRQREIIRLEKAGVIRGYSNEHYDKMTCDEIRDRLIDLHEESVVAENVDDTQKQKLALITIERTRYLKFWADNSTVLNHGHMLMMVANIYDEAFFFTPQEMKAMGKAEIDVQRIVEKPHVYILGRCASSEIEQIAYVPTRAECLKELNTKVYLKSGIQVNDVMRFFTGDGPEQDSECGEQQGGHAGCVACSGDSRRYHDICYSFSRPVLSLEERVEIVRKGPAGRSLHNGGLKPFVGLSPDNLKRECNARGLEDEGSKKDLEARLKESLGGIQRLPSLLLSANGTELQDLNLERYEIAPTEPLHDIKEHIKNLTNELPKQLLQNEKLEFLKMADVLFNSKDKIRGSDYRLAIIIIAEHMRGKCRNIVQNILDSMVDITRIVYLPECRRTIKLILRLHNQTFLHCMWCKILVGLSPKVLTKRKFYGRYWHSLTTHAPILYRIISLSSVHTEEEERNFSAINSIANSTTSRRHDEIITPTLVRLQAESKLKEKETHSSFSKQNSKISQFSKILPEFPNSLIPHGFLIKNPNEVQSHYERISDFLACGEGIWWRRDIRGVEFFDGDSEPSTRPEGPVLHHFRHSNLKKETDYLNNEWQKCLYQKITLPLLRIRCRNEKNSADVVLNTNYFEDDTHDNTPDDVMITMDEEPSNPENHNSEDEGNNSENEMEIGFECADNDVDLLLSEDHPVDEISTPPSVDQCSALPAQPTCSLTLPTLLVNKEECESPASQQFQEPTPMPVPSQLSAEYNNQNLNTELAKNIFIILPNNFDLIKQLDKARVHWKDMEVQTCKTAKAHAKVLYEKYLDILVNVQTRVLAQYDPLKAELKGWEENFFLENNQREPQREDILNDKEAYSLYKKLKLCKQLLNHWKMKFL